MARGWWRKVRPPVLLTLPGDILAGVFLASQGAGLPVIPLVSILAAGLLLFAGGFFLKDWADAKADQRDGTVRPIPIGWVIRRLAWPAVLICFPAGGALAVSLGREPAMAAFALTVALVNHGLLTKNLPFLEPVNLGLCRAVNLVLGATVVSGFHLSAITLAGAVILFLHVAALCHLATRPAGRGFPSLSRWMPCLVLGMAFFGLLPLAELVHWPGQVAFALVWLAAVIHSGRVAVLLPQRFAAASTGMPVPWLIDRCTGALPAVQAGLVLVSGDSSSALTVGILLFSLWPLAWIIR